MRRLPAGLAALAMLWLVGGCAAGPGERASVTGGPAETVRADQPASRAATAVKQRGAHLSGKEINLAVYYVRTVDGRRYLVPEWHPVPSTKAVATAAVNELLGGQPVFRDSRRPFPAGARLLGLRLEGGTATVDLSGAALRGWDGQARRWPLQALVHTLTQFPTVRRVLVRVGGRSLGPPLARDPEIPLAPIALAQPTPDARVKGGRLVVTGQASVYEGTVGLRLRDGAGQVLAQGYATADAGAPGRGSFSGALSFTPPASPNRWTLEAFEVSPENGDILYLVNLRVWVGR
jgi:immunoglobulin-like protein involved in spore germination/sporulation and spore germination protein